MAFSRNMSGGAWFTEDQLGGQEFSLKITKTLVSKQTAFQKLDIYETEKYGILLTLDDLVMTTEKDEFVYHELIAHVPLFAHPNPRNVLIIGGGDGGTAREILKHPGVEHIDMVEIDQDVVALSRQYMPFLAHELDNPKVRLYFQDGVAFVKQATDTYDIIIIDSTDPIGPGEGLFDTAFYTDCAAILNADGILVSQAESPFNNPNWVTEAFTKLRNVFPNVQAYLGLIPTYPGGSWCFAFCTKTSARVGSFDEARFDEMRLDLRYYNKAMHSAAFALPEFVKRLCEAA